MASSLLKKVYAKNRYKMIEKREKNKLYLNPDMELKSVGNTNQTKNNLYTPMNKFQRFGCQVDMQQVHDNVLEDKKSKQRFKDYALCRGVKYIISEVAKDDKINLNEPCYVHLYVDEQTVTTNGRYNLSDTIKTELFVGKHNFNTGTFIEPLFNEKGELELLYKNSKMDHLIRASDIVANKIFALSHEGELTKCNFPIIFLP